jgi:tetratricopeptide (TPR) repeat protein
VEKPNEDEIDISEYKINYRQKGIDLAKQDKHEEAIVCFDKAIVLHEDIGAEIEPELMISKAQSLTKLGREEEAKTCYEIAVDLIAEDMDDYLEEIPVEFTTGGTTAYEKLDDSIGDLN